MTSSAGHPTQGGSDQVDPYAFYLDFDQTAPGSAGDGLLPTLGHGAMVKTNSGGMLEFVAHGKGRAVRFPPPCDRRRCPEALIALPDSPDLDPGTRSFSFGATIRVRKSELTRGSNIVQKGGFNEPGGQWKLQIDNVRGRPSCVVQGIASGARSQAKVKAATGVADGRWHTVTCHKSGDHVSIEVDGTTRGRTRVHIGTVTNDAPVHIGNNAVGKHGGDQFHGALTTAFLRVG